MTAPLARRLALAASLALLCGLSAQPSSAADGDLDSTFDFDGEATVYFDRAPAATDHAVAVTATASGGLLFAGSAVATGSDVRVAVARVDSTGAGLQKKVLQFATSTFCGATAVLWRAQDDKIVVVGVSAADSRIGLARLTGALVLDSTFGSAATPGSILHSLPGGTLFDVAAADQQTDGKILVAGSGRQTDFDDLDYFVARFSETGQLDETFGSGGVRWISFDRGGTKNDGLGGLALQPDGRIVMSGTIEADDDLDVGFARLTSGGNLDATFDGDSGTGNGKVVWELTDAFADKDERGVRLALQPNGRILFAGTYAAAGAGTLAPQDSFFGRLLSDGRVDSSLPLSIPNLPIAESTKSFGILRQSDDKLLVTLGSDSSGCIVARYDANGANLDPSFHGVGYREIQMQSYGTYCEAASLSSGRVVLAGRVELDGTDHDFFAARLRSQLIFRDGFGSGNLNGWIGW